MLFFSPLLCNSKPALFFKLKFSRLLVHNMNLCLSGFSLNTGTHEKKSWVISIRNGGCCNLFYVHFFTRIFFLFSPLLEGTWVHGTWISVGVSPSAPASLCCGSGGSPETIGCCSTESFPKLKKCQGGTALPKGCFPQGSSRTEI